MSTVRSKHSISNKSFTVALNRHWAIVNSPTGSPTDIIASANEMFELAGTPTQPAVNVLGRGENGITFETTDNKAIKIIR